MKDQLHRYLEEIDSVREIYTQEYSLEGSILDVGGHQGCLRHFLNAGQVSLYVSVDPYLNVFENVASCPNMLKAYPSLAEPCNFLACHAESLPFRDKAFDWVHMRSVLDHFYDPYRALLEVYRVLRDGGSVLIGLTVTGGQSTLKADDDNEDTTYVSPFVPKVLRLFKSFGMIKAAKYELKTFSTKPLGDYHMSCWKYEKLLNLLRSTNFTITKEHWQKPPYTACLYVAGRKQPLE